MRRSGSSNRAAEDPEPQAGVERPRARRQRASTTARSTTNGARELPGQNVAFGAPRADGRAHASSSARATSEDRAAVSSTSSRSGSASSRWTARRARRSAPGTSGRSPPGSFRSCAATGSCSSISLVLSVIASVVALAEPWPLAIVIDSVLGTHAPPGSAAAAVRRQPDPYRLLVFIVGLGFLIAVVSHGVRVINDYVNAKVEQNMVMDLRSDMFDHVSKLSLTFHDEKHTGMLMSLINMQASAIGAIVMAFPPMFESLLMLIGMLDDRAADRLAGDARVAGLRAVHLLGARAVRHPHRAAHPARAEPRVPVALDRVRGDVDAARDRRLRPPAARALPLHHAGPDGGRRARAADRLADAVLARRHDRDRARHRARARLRRLARAAGRHHAGRADRPDLLHRRRLPAARVDQPDDRPPAPAASCS